MKYKVLILTLLTFAVSGTSLISREHRKRCCKRHAPKYECQNENEEYDPYSRYYPYGSIYQDSKVQNVTNDDEESYWPGKRDDDFIDSLTR